MTKILEMVRKHHPIQTNMKDFHHISKTLEILHLNECFPINTKSPSDSIKSQISEMTNFRQQGYSKSHIPQKFPPSLRQIFACFIISNPNRDHHQSTLSPLVVAIVVVIVHPHRTPMAKNWSGSASKTCTVVSRHRVVIVTRLIQKRTLIFAIFYTRKRTWNDLPFNANEKSSSQGYKRSNSTVLLVV